MKAVAPPPGRSGAVLVFALLLLVVGALVLGGVAQMTATQSVAGETEWTAMERRIQLENSRAMARQYLLSHMFTFTNGSPAITVADARGGFTLSAQNVGNFWATASVTATNSMLNINPFNMMERGGFYRVWIPGTVSDGTTNDVGWNFQVRTRSPLAAGYTFVKHRPSPVNQVGLYATPPYIDMTTLGAFVGFEGLPRLPVSSVTSTNGSDTTGFLGYLDIPIGASAWGVFTNVTYSLWTNGTSLQVELNLTTPSTTPDSALLFDIPAAAPYTNASNVVVNLPVHAVVLRGAPTDDYEVPVHILAGVGTTNLDTLVLSNNNRRRVYVNLQKAVNAGNAIRVLATNTSEWRLAVTASRFDVNFETGTMPIKGGIRTDANVTFPLGAAYFTRETDPRGLDSIGDRMMWLEDNRAL